MESHANRTVADLFLPFLSIGASVKPAIKHGKIFDLINQLEHSLSTVELTSLHNGFGLLDDSQIDSFTAGTKFKIVPSEDAYDNFVFVVACNTSVRYRIHPLTFLNLFSMNKIEAH